MRATGEIRKLVRLEASPATDEEFIEVFLAEPKGKIRVHRKEVDSEKYFSLEQIDQWISGHPEDFATGFVTCYRAWRDGDVSASC